MELLDGLGCEDGQEKHGSLPAPSEARVGKRDACKKREAGEGLVVQESHVEMFSNYVQAAVRTPLVCSQLSIQGVLMNVASPPPLSSAAYFPGIVSSLPVPPLLSFAAVWLQNIPAQEIERAWDAMDGEGTGGGGREGSWSLSFFPHPQM